MPKACPKDLYYFICIIKIEVFQSKAAFSETSMQPTHQTPLSCTLWSIFVEQRYSYRAHDPESIDIAMDKSIDIRTPSKRGFF